MSDLRPERLHLQDVNAQHIVICGRPFIADVSGALYWPAERALIVADLKLGGLSDTAARGLNGSNARAIETLKTLAETVDRHNARTIIALGQGLERPLDTSADCPPAEPEHLASAAITHDDVLKILRILQEDCEWIWIDGQQGGRAAAAEASSTRNQIEQDLRDLLGGIWLSELSAGGITLRHKPLKHCQTHEIAGHLRPAARVSNYGHVMRRPCFIGDGKRLVLPAFASHRGGANVLDEAFEGLFGSDGLAAWMMGQDGVYPISTRRLVKD